MKSEKTLKTLCSVLMVLLLLFGVFTVISHTVYHRSDMATAAELLFRLQGTKKKFSDPEECAAYIEKRAQAEEYTLNVSLKSNITESELNGNKIYTLKPDKEAEYRILYLHGGAYINDASAYHWKLCDRLVQECQAEVIFPIYPLTPNHTWEETYEMITEIYQEMQNNVSAPLIIMGDSAGGGLSVAFCEYIETLSLPQPDALILFSPWMDVSMSNPAAANYESADPMLSAYGLIEMGKCWAGELPLEDYRISPIFGDISVLQNVTLFVGTREIFYPDVTLFYELLQREGVVSVLHIGEGMNHVYPLYPIPEADTAFEQIVATLKKI